MREKVAKGLWGREGERGEGKNVGACAWRAARWGGTGGALCIRENIVICVLVKRKEEPGR